MKAGLFALFGIILLAGCISPPEPTPTETPLESPTATPEISPAASPEASASPTATPEISPAASPEVSPAASPSPTASCIRQGSNCTSDTQCCSGLACLDGACQPSSQRCTENDTGLNGTGINPNDFGVTTGYYNLQWGNWSDICTTTSGGGGLYEYSCANARSRNVVQTFVDCRWGCVAGRCMDCPGCPGDAGHVCGFDNHSYLNDCVARCAGNTRLYYSECESRVRCNLEAQPVCPPGGACGYGSVCVPCWWTEDGC